MSAYRPHRRQRDAVNDRRRARRIRAALAADIDVPADAGVTEDEVRAVLAHLAGAADHRGEVTVHDNDEATTYRLNFPKGGR